jgi:hypothetical protein
MSCERTTEWLSDRLKGELSAEDERLLETHLAGCPACRAEADAVTALWADMGAIEDDVPHERMRARFHAALAAYEQRLGDRPLDRFIERLWPKEPVLQAGIALVLLLVGLVAGNALPGSTDREMAGLREELRTVSLALLDHQSASERLRAIEWSKQGLSDTRVVDALVETVRGDRNVNVRLAALAALSNRIDRPEVGVALTDALRRQRAPLMQVALAEVLLDGNVDGSAAAIEMLLEEEGLDPSVRDYLLGVLQEARNRTGTAEVL